MVSMATVARLLGGLLLMRTIIPALILVGGTALLVYLKTMRPRPPRIHEIDETGRKRVP